MRSANKALLMIVPLVLVALILISFDNCSKKEGSPAELFQSLSLLETESEDYAISSVTKIDFSSDKIFIFDKRQKRIFTLSDSFSFLYTIASPGQGPGELDDPVDFAVCEDKIIILERFPRRLDIFDLKGAFLGRVNLKIPEEISYSYPSGILPGPENSYLITYSLSSHLLDVYDDQGNYQTTWLQREDSVLIYRKNIGNESAIGYSAGSKSILHFSLLQGEFTEIYPDGSGGRRFRIPDKALQKLARELRSSFEQDAQASNIQSDVVSFILYTSFCVDEEDRLYVAQFRLEAGSPGQTLWVFNPDGKCQLGRLTLPGGEKLRDLDFWKGQFFLVSDQEQIWVTKRR